MEVGGEYAGSLEGHRFCFFLVLRAEEEEEERVCISLDFRMYWVVVVLNVLRMVSAMELWLWLSRALRVDT